MALKVPETFLSKDETRKYADPEERLYRLAPNHVQDLRDVARGVEESDVGVCCSYLVDSMSGEGGDFDECALSAIERFAEQSLSFDFLGDLFGVATVARWRDRVQRCRRALAKLHERGDHRSVSVLFVAYGYPDAILRQIPELYELGPVLGSLAKYTDATEAARYVLVRREALSKDRRFAPATRELGREWRGVDRYGTDEIRREAGDARVLSGSEKSRAALSLGLDASAGNAGVVDLARVRERASWADRSVSSGDALRFALPPFAEPVPELREGETKPAFEARKANRKEREKTHREKRAGFLTSVRIDAAKMLSAAEKAYHGAWLASASVGRFGRGERQELKRSSRLEPRIPDARVRGAGWSST